MGDYKIVVDATCDLPKEYLEKNDILWLDLSYAIGDSEYTQSGENQIPLKEFYDRMRAGEPTRTSQVTPNMAEEKLEPYAKSGVSVLAVIFSSMISGTSDSVRTAINSLKEKYPDWQAVSIDSLCASMGHGLLIDAVVENKRNGMSFEENAKWAEDNKLSCCHLFTVDNLEYLHRGGRVSKVQAIVGKMLKIKPCLHVDDQGRLIPIAKVRGRMKAIEWLSSKMFEIVGDSYEGKVFISHCDSLEDALVVKKAVQEKYSIPEERMMINIIGPVIGSHSGPGTVALFFTANRRK